MLERYGLDLTKEKRDLIRKMIQNNQSRFLHKTSNTRTVHEVILEGKPIRVVWDKLHETIVTVLPERTQTGIPPGQISGG